MTTKPQPTTEALEPCPFNGEKVRMVRQYAPANLYIQCACGISMDLEVITVNGEPEWAKAEQRLRARWNTRLSPASTAPVVDKARYEKAHDARYMMTHPVHPDILVLWFLALKSHWFDDPANMFFGQREQAKAYLYKWVETGELADDNTTLEITVAMKFREWLKESWTPAAATAASERLLAPSSKREVLRLLDAIEQSIRSLSQPLAPTETATRIKLSADHGLSYVAALRERLSTDYGGTP